MKLRLYATRTTGRRTRLGVMPSRITIDGPLRPEEADALGNCLGYLVQEGLTRIGYDPYHQVFYFRGRRSLEKDRETGFVLSLQDAKAGACATILEPPSF